MASRPWPWEHGNIATSLSIIAYALDERGEGVSAQDRGKKCLTNLQSGWNGYATLRTVTALFTLSPLFHTRLNPHDSVSRGAQAHRSCFTPKFHCPSQVIQVFCSPDISEKTFESRTRYPAISYAVGHDPMFLKLYWAHSKFVWHKACRMDLHAGLSIEYVCICVCSVESHSCHDLDLKDRVESESVAWIITTWPAAKDWSFVPLSSWTSAVVLPALLAAQISNASLLEMAYKKNTSKKFFFPTSRQWPYANMHAMHACTHR
jgi:hypothetical protein